MSKLILKHENYWDNVLYRFELFTDSDFSKIKGVNQVYGVILNPENKVLLVAGNSKKWILPGGGVEAGEGLVDTLVREAYEEAAVVVDQKTIKPLFFQKVYSLTDNQEKYLGIGARFVCRIERQDDFIEDPDLGDIKHQIFVSVPELDKYLRWDDTTKFIQKELMDKHIKAQN